MITIRKSEERGHADYDWLKTWHTFSFADYYDPKYVSFRCLRVINEDHIAPASGFPQHPHQNMEIVTYLIEGALQHQDSMGHSTIIRPGEVQRMTAGTGIFHSEFNPDHKNKTHLLQIWITPETHGLPCSYEQKNFGKKLEEGNLILIASKNGRGQSLHINQNVDIYAGRVEDAGLTKFTPSFHHQWIQLVSGELHLLGETLQPGDGAAISKIPQLKIAWSKKTEFLLFDMP